MTKNSNWKHGGWLYLTVIIDLFSWMAVGWVLISSLSHETVVTALKRAISNRRPVVESFFGVRKTELVYHEKYHPRQDTRHSIFEYIEAFYNRD